MTQSYRALSWNIWGHREPELLKQDLLPRLATTDIFAFQEVTSAPALYRERAKVFTHNDANSDEPPTMLSGLQHLLEEVIDAPKQPFGVMYEPSTSSTWKCQQTGVSYENVEFGSFLAYNRHRVNLFESGVETIGENSLFESTPRPLQWIVFGQDDDPYLFAHLHGVWIANNTKGDHVLRDQQSLEVLESLFNIACKYEVRKIIFSGDLNLDINTKALRRLEEGYHLFPDFTFVNQIRNLGYTNTRTPRYRKYGQPGESMFADYVLTSPDVKIDRFSANTNTMASDHAPMEFTFH